MARSTDVDTFFIDIITFKRGTLAHFMLIIILDKVPVISIFLIKNAHILRKKRNRGYPTETDTSYAEDLAFLPNLRRPDSSCIAWCKKHGGIDLYVFSGKTEFISLKGEKASLY